VPSIELTGYVLFRADGRRWRAITRAGEPAGPRPATGDLERGVTVEEGVALMLNQLGTFLPRQGERLSWCARTAALRYAAWGWPLAPDPRLAASTDLEQVFAAWSRLPGAPIYAACGSAFEVVEAGAGIGRAALARLDRLCVPVGPVLRYAVLSAAGPCASKQYASGNYASGQCASGQDSPDLGTGAEGADESAGGCQERFAFLVRPGTAQVLRALIDRERTDVALFGEGGHCELPTTLQVDARGAGGVQWLRLPSTARPALPSAHAILGALALSPHAAFTR
jgi:hypothetical protein